MEELWNILDWKEDIWNQDRLEEIAPEIQELQENITFYRVSPLGVVSVSVKFHVHLPYTTQDGDLHRCGCN